MPSAQSGFTLSAFIISCILVQVCFCLRQSDKDIEGGNDGFCAKDNEDCGFPTQSERAAKHAPLVRLPGIEIGHIENVVLNDDQNFDEDDERVELEMKTVSLKPPIFEIPGFLTDHECQHFIDMATQKGLKDSHTVKGPRDPYVAQEIRLMDIDKDKRLSLSEMMLTLENSYDYYLEESDLLMMYEKLDIDKNNDEYITPEELGSVRPKDMETYLSNFIKANPIKRSRMSKQVWLNPRTSNDHIFMILQDKVQQVTKLPRVLIKKSDFQVVNYGMHGHYNAHQDSSPVNQALDCCSRERVGNCRICRYMTILFYLNDVEEGGGTAFPLAGNDTYDVHAFRMSHQVNLQRHCDSANLIVTPEKGKAVIWYNHYIDPTTGWMGDLDEYTWHGGCPVTRGEKWIANFWIKTTHDPFTDLQT